MHSCHTLINAIVRCDPVVEELLFLVFQPATCRADNVLVVRKFGVFTRIRLV